MDAARTGVLVRPVTIEDLRWARDAGHRSMQFDAVVETKGAAVHRWRSLGMEVKRPRGADAGVSGARLPGPPAR